MKHGETLETTVFYAGYSDHGMGGASRTFHDFQIAHIPPDHAHTKLRPVLHNSWEATAFDIAEAEQMALAEKAATIGAGRFVVNEGWFGARNSDHTGLGDWTVKPAQIP